MEDVGWYGRGAAEAPGESWTECSNPHPCCERGHESFRSAELKSTGEYQSNHLQPTPKTSCKLNVAFKPESVQH